MKNIIKSVSILLFVAATMVACEPNLEPANVGELSVNLQLVCTDPQVKATEAGDNTYNENTINHIDYFVYADQTGATCLKHARVTPSDGHATVVLTDLVQAEQLAEGDNCYIYVVANWPATLADDLSLASLRLKRVTENDLDVATAANHRFVMNTQAPVVATVSRTGAEVTANLHRLEAKLTMKVNIPASITSNGVTYTPEPNSLRIYYLYATNTGTLNGSAMSYGAGTDAYYFDYPFNRAVTVTGNTTDGYVGTAAPFYTYPEKWQSHEISAPYFKVILSWRSSSGAQEAKPYYYKVLLPESMGGQIDRNTIYKFIMNIGVLGSETDDGAVEIDGNYYVVDWLSGAHLGEDGEITRGKYLEVAQETYYIYGGNSIEIPVTSSHNINVAVNSATYTDFSTVTSTTQDLDGSAYSVTTDGRFSFTLTHNLVTNVTSPNLDCSPYRFEMTITNGVEGLVRHVTVIQYPPVYISSERSNGYVFINGHNNRFTNVNNYELVYDDGAMDEYVWDPYINNDDLSGLLSLDPYSVTYEDSHGAQVYFKYAESVSMGGGRYAKSMGLDFIWPLPDPDGYVTVTAPNNGTITRIVLTYYNNRNNQSVTYSISGTGSYTTSSSKTEWVGAAKEVRATMPYASNNTNLISAIHVEYYIASSPQFLGSIRSYSYMSGGDNSNPNIYTVSVSSLSGTDWYIADPRSETPVTYSALRGGSSSGTPLTGYRPTGTEYADAVAPQFKVASSYGASLTNSVGQPTFENAQKRCASYQENGYPAGRWRIPTDAEIRFMVYLSANGKLPPLFNGVYWSASGYVLEVDENGHVTILSSQTTSSVRCVYDSWYWGNDPMSAYATTWSGWQTSN